MTALLKVLWKGGLMHEGIIGGSWLIIRKAL